MATIKPSLSTRVDARGKSEILLRFVGGREHIYRLHSRLFVSPSRWKDNAVVIPRLESQEQNELRELRDQLRDLSCFLLDRFQEGDQSAIDRKWMQESVDLFFHPDREKGQDILPLFDEFIAAANDISISRKKRYAVIKDSLKRFQAYKGETLTAMQFGTDTLEAYQAFLVDEHNLAGSRKWAPIYRNMKRLPGERSKNAVIDYLNVLRTFFHWMTKRGISNADPYRGFSMGTAVYGTPYYLTIEELERIRTVDLHRHPSLEVQRDIFVFQCLVGCRVGDLIKMRKGDIVDGVLTYIPRKTIEDRAVVVRVPLNHTALELVDAYAPLPGERLFPFISNQKYNDALKRIFLAARMRRKVSVLDPLTRKEIKRPLCEIASSHIARRTFIGNLYKQVSDPNLIGAMSGHKEGSRAFSRYRSIDDEMKAGLVEMLEAKKPK